MSGFIIVFSAPLLFFLFSPAGEREPALQGQGSVPHTEALRLRISGAPTLFSAPFSPAVPPPTYRDPRKVKGDFPYRSVTGVVP